MAAAAAALAHPPASEGRATTSDLSVDEELVLHAIGWEPVALVSGTSLHSIPVGMWNWGQGEIEVASDAFTRAFSRARDGIEGQALTAGGTGVVGVHVEWSVRQHFAQVALVGTAVRPSGGDPGTTPDRPFSSDLSGRDFSLLHQAGWEPRGLAVGASFVYVPRRSMRTALSQKGQNVELTNFTRAMYDARESAMERMQHAAQELDGHGVVEVKVAEGPLAFAGHAVGFMAYGTVVRESEAGHRDIGATAVVPLDDTSRLFEAASLRGRSSRARPG
jgi:uncharacterized protein YbjQ (UPF0145 family)